MFKWWPPRLDQHCLKANLSTASRKKNAVATDVKRIGGAGCGWPKNKPKSTLTEVSSSFDFRIIVHDDIQALVANIFKHLCHIYVVQWFSITAFHRAVPVFESWCRHKNF